MGPSRLSTPTIRNPIGIWYITVPSGEDRAEYIKNCYNTSTVSIINMGNELLHKVPIGKSAIGYIEFPEDGDSVGSPVLCVVEPYHKQPLVVEVFNSGSDYNAGVEYEKKITRSDGASIAEVSVQGEKGVINFSVDSEESDGGIVNINVTNAEEQGKLNVNVNGNIAIVQTNGSTIMESSDSISFIVRDKDVKNIISYQKGIGFSYKDEFDNEVIINKENIQMLSQLINLGDGSEKAALGETLQSKLEQIIDQISAIANACATIIVPTGVGPSGVPTNAALFTSASTELDTIKAALPEILSGLVNLD